MTGAKPSQSGSRWKWLVIPLVLAALGALLYPAVKRAGNPRGPHGATIPLSAPEESRRVVHPTGLSMIAPPNWDSIRDRGPQTPHLCLAARGAPGRRLKSVITVEACSPPGPEQLRNFARIQFHLHEAFEKMEVERKSTFDDPASSRYTMYVDAGGQCWAVTLLVADELSVLPVEIRKYLETIQFPERPADVAHSP